MQQFEISPGRWFWSYQALEWLHHRVWQYLLFAIRLTDIGKLVCQNDFEESYQTKSQMIRQWTPSSALQSTLASPESGQRDRSVPHPARTGTAGIKDISRSGKTVLSKPASCNSSVCVALRVAYVLPQGLALFQPSLGFHLLRGPVIAQQVRLASLYPCKLKLSLMISSHYGIHSQYRSI